MRHNQIVRLGKKLGDLDMREIDFYTEEFRIGGNGFKPPKIVIFELACESLFSSSQK